MSLLFLFVSAKGNLPRQRGSLLGKSDAVGSHLGEKQTGLRPACWREVYTHPLAQVILWGGGVVFEPGVGTDGKRKKKGVSYGCV